MIEDFVYENYTEVVPAEQRGDGSEFVQEQQQAPSS